MKKYLILIAGCPATGKSYLIREIKTMLPTVFTITPDEGKEMLADAIGFHSKEEKKALENEISLLNDDDYVARYARENYVFTREGEQVAIIPGVE